MVAEHPFAPFIRLLGKGPHLSRPLTEDEAFQAGTMILQEKIEPQQLGAFLSLVRMTTETIDEMVGFTRAMREYFQVPLPFPKIDLDWPSYAGKKNRNPWFLLSALLLASHGIKILMHGKVETVTGRLYGAVCLKEMGLKPAESLSEASEQIDKTSFAYLSLETLAPPLDKLLNQRLLLGLRNPFHSLVRDLNPFLADYQIIGIAHPAYRSLHLMTGLKLAQKNMLVFKGDGGEAEIRPEKQTELAMIQSHQETDLLWDPLIVGAATDRQNPLNPQQVRDCWFGLYHDPIATATIISTTAAIILMMNRATSQAEANEKALYWWTHRHPKLTLT